MSDKQVSQKTFFLDTKSFDKVAELCKDLAEKLSDTINEMDLEKDKLMFTWTGEGRNTFEKKYRILSQQFTDISDDLRDISESVYQMEEEYIQADVELAKAMDGKTNRY